MNLCVYILYICAYIYDEHYFLFMLGNKRASLWMFVHIHVHT